MLKKAVFKALFPVLVISVMVPAYSSEQSYKDVPFWQDYTQKIPLPAQLKDQKLLTVRSDRNGRILILSEQALLQVSDNQICPASHYRPLADTNISQIDTYKNQFIYLTDKLVFSNAWAGRFSVNHALPLSNRLVMGSNFDFLLANRTKLVYYHNGNAVNSWNHSQPIRQLEYDSNRNRFFVLYPDRLDVFSLAGSAKTVYNGSQFTCLDLSKNGAVLLVGTKRGYFTLNTADFSEKSALNNRLPCSEIRCLRVIGDKIWFGSPRGAFAMKPAFISKKTGQIAFDYYASRRWLVDDDVVDIAPGPGNSVLILTRQGLSIIHFKRMTLAQKAAHFEKITRKRHVRYGLNSAFVMDKPGALSSGTLVDQDNDGLWTSMYLAGELYRYGATHSRRALQNSYEAFAAMERLELITPMPGFPARSFDRAGYARSDRSRWQKTVDGKWVWKATTSSDEIVGHFYAFAVFAEIVPDAKYRKRAISLMDRIMDHIVRHDLYLVDFDGKPTQWGRWNPEYVNKFPRAVGDRRLNSVEIISFLQAAYHFTGKDIYKKKAYELLYDKGYLDNILIPIREIGRVPGINLTTEWNHSDDELAFLSYGNLYKYAFTKELQGKYLQAIRDHWQAERPEKNPLWNLIYAQTGARRFDLAETIWDLREFPLDMISWTVQNSRREDLDFLPENFRQQSTRRVLPPDERPMSKYNGNAFRLDGGNGGRREFSGDIYLQPYWLGRYLKVIR